MPESLQIVISSLEPLSYDLDAFAQGLAHEDRSACIDASISFGLEQNASQSLSDEQLLPKKVITADSGRTSLVAHSLKIPVLDIFCEYSLDPRSAIAKLVDRVSSDTKIPEQESDDYQLQVQGSRKYFDTVLLVDEDFETREIECNKALLVSLLEPR